MGMNIFRRMFNSLLELRNKELEPEERFTSVTFIVGSSILCDYVTREMPPLPRERSMEENLEISYLKAIINPTINVICGLLAAKMSIGLIDIIKNLTAYKVPRYFGYMCLGAAPYALFVVLSNKKSKQE